MLNSVKVIAPAKVNLALRVGSPRPSGYHPLETVFLALNIGDVVEVSEADELSVSSDDAGVPLDESNLVIKAAKALQEHTGTSKGAAIRITKRIPIAGGMAGGSADCAAALVGLNELWGLDLSEIELGDIGATLGADVPFALLGGCAVGTNSGDDVRPIQCAEELSFVFVRSDEGLSTPEVFAHYDKLNPEHHLPESVDDLEDVLRLGQVERLGDLMINDLEPAAFELRPDLAELKDKLADFGPVILSGSGPTMAVLAGSNPESLEASIYALGFDSFHASGPAAGAHILRSA